MRNRFDQPSGEARLVDVGKHEDPLGNRIACLVSNET